MERDAIFGKLEEGTYLYCFHCERAYEYGNFRQIDNLQMCPYENCTGDAVMNAHEWTSIRQAHKDYPEIPELNKVYPLN